MTKYTELRAALGSGPTPGKWANDGNEVYAEQDCEYHAVAVCGPSPSCRCESECIKNASYIAACNPEAIRALLAERDALREVLTDLTSANGHVEYGRALARSRALLAQRES